MAPSISLVTPPACEPLSLSDAKLQLGMDSSETYDDARISRLIVSARRTLENITRRALITQRWTMKLDGWPPLHPLYSARGFPEILIPKPPLQSLVSFQYVDTGGILQTLQQQTDYGADASMMYGYQLNLGSETQPARLTPPWARPWPPLRMVPENVIVDFWAGYCSAVYLSTAASTAAIAGTKFDPGDDGDDIYIPGAGPAGSMLVGVLAVDDQGNGTVTPAPSNTVSNVVAFVGGYVPEEILDGMRMQIAYLYAQRGDVLDKNVPCGAPGVEDLVSYYINYTA